MKSSAITNRVLSVARTFSLLFGVASLDCPTPVFAQSLVPGDVKSGKPDQIIKLGESLHVEAR
jgi:hypothetical protein